jgi:hypothetical protein
MDIISSPWRVDENGMCCGERPSSGHENELGKTKHSGGTVSKSKFSCNADVLLFFYVVTRQPLGCTI